MFKSIRSLAIFVTDLEKAKIFYTEKLNFEVVFDVSDDLCFLKSRSGMIDIYLKGGCKPCSCGCENSRLSFFLETEGSVKEAFIKLKQKGVKVMQDEPTFVGDDTFCFQFADPDGNLIEVSGS